MMANLMQSLKGSSPLSTVRQRKKLPRNKAAVAADVAEVAGAAAEQVVDAANRAAARKRKAAAVVVSQAAAIAGAVASPPAETLVASATKAVPVEPGHQASLHRWHVAGHSLRKTYWRPAP